MGAHLKKKPSAELKRPKMVRGSFALPETEYAALAEMKRVCLEAGVAVKKSELLRAALAHIGGMDAPRLKQALDALPPLNSGRPKKGK